MNLTKKTVKTEVETTETVCEIVQEEFADLCARTAADVITEFMGDTPTEEDFMAGVQLTTLFALFAAKLDMALFDEPKTNKTQNTKEEK